MRKGFSLLELLVASLLLGMLMTILTMVFSQSSIAWRTGIAGLSDLDTVRENVGKVRNEADNAYVWDKNTPKVTSVLSIWRTDAGSRDGSARLRERAVDSGVVNDVQQGEKIDLLLSAISSGNEGKAGQTVNNLSLACGSGESVGGEDAVSYSVNVRSAGPDRQHNTYDDIWSFPDDFDL